MYCDAPARVHPSAGKVQTVTAISEVDGDAAGVVAGVDAAGDVLADATAAGVVITAAAGVDEAEWLDVGFGLGESVSASVAPTPAAAIAAAAIASSQRREERLLGPVFGGPVFGGPVFGSTGLPDCAGGAVVPAC